MCPLLSTREMSTCLALPLRDCHRKTLGVWTTTWGASELLLQGHLQRSWEERRENKWIPSAESFVVHVTQSLSFTWKAMRIRGQKIQQHVTEFIEKLIHFIQCYRWTKTKLFRTLSGAKVLNQLGPQTHSGIKSRSLATENVHKRTTFS